MTLLMAPELDRAISLCCAAAMQPSDARLDFRSELMAALRLIPGALVRVGDRELVAVGPHHWLIGEILYRITRNMHDGLANSAELDAATKAAVGTELANIFERTMCVADRLGRDQ